MIFRKISFLFILLTVFGCSTKKNTWVSRNYHNLTAYYNVYYNGRESFNNGEKAIVEAYENDYSKILPLFEVSDPDAASAGSGEMDRAIEKGYKLIKKHSITAKAKKKEGKSRYTAEFNSRKEYNVWVDDAYVLIGKAHLYKHEYLQALRVFQHVTRDFPDLETYYEALLWQARTYTEKEDYTAALSALESYDLGGNAPLELYSDYMAAYANMLLEQGKYADAIPYLRNAAGDEKNKHKRLRYDYVLAQLYMLNGQRKEAADVYKIVAKASPDYEMSFNARVNMASIIYDEADVVEVKKQLNKLRKDKKNKEYLDRIYYAFGQVYLQENKDKEALSSFKKSVGASVSNEKQKGLSYYEAGNIYYDWMDYANAYFYYDSAIVVVDEDYEEIDVLKERHYGLSGLIDHLLIVEREDSLQRLADMNEPVLYAYLDDIIKEKEEEQRRLKKQQEEGGMDDSFFYQNSGTTNNIGQTGKWYFYNQTSMGMGKMEFEKRWGKRKLEDNWRRKDKSKVVEEDDESGSPDDPFAVDDPFASGEDKSIPEDEKSLMQESSGLGAVPTREELLADIPLTTEQRQASDKKVATALLEQGFVFMDRLENYPKAIEVLEELLSRYPEAETRDEALIALYNAYRLNGDETGMQLTKARIEKEYPDHRFVAFLNDPRFFDKIEEKKRKEAEAYEATYKAFLFGRYDEVVIYADNVVEKEPENKLTDKYLLLRGLSYGKKGEVELFKADLNTIINNNKGGEESAMATALLKHLDDGKVPVQGTLYSSAPGVQKTVSEEGEEVAGLTQEAAFVYVENEPYEIIVLGVEQQNINTAIYHVADYNFSRYLLNDFEIQEKRLLDGSLVIVVTGFNNKVEVMDYFYGLRENPDFFGFDYFADNIVALSESNNSKFYLSGLVKDYQDFFATYYLQHVSESELEKVILKEGEVKPEEAEEIEQVDEEVSITETQDDEMGKLPEVIDTSEEEVVPQQEEEQVDKFEEKEVEQKEEEETKEEVKEQEEIEPEPVMEKVDTTAVTEEVEEIVPEVESVFSYDGQQAHSVYVVVRKTRMDYNRLQKSYATYTRNIFGAGLQVKLEDFGTSYRMIRIDGFENADAAKDYIDSIKKSSLLMRDIERKEHYIWAVSGDNQKKLIEMPDIEAYDSFFKTNY